MDLAQLKQDCQTLRVPVILNKSVIWDWAALVRVINAMPEMIQALEECREENDQLTRMVNGF